MLCIIVLSPQAQLTQYDPELAHRLSRSVSNSENQPELSKRRGSGASSHSSVSSDEFTVTTKQSPVIEDVRRKSASLPKPEVSSAGDAHISDASLVAPRREKVKKKKSSKAKDSVPEEDSAGFEQESG